MSDFEITIRRALRQGGYTGAIPGGQPFGVPREGRSGTGALGALPFAAACS